MKHTNIILVDCNLFFFVFQQLFRQKMHTIVLCTYRENTLQLITSRQNEVKALSYQIIRGTLY